MQMRVTKPPSQPILRRAGHSSPAHAKRPAPVLSIFAYSNEVSHANEDDLFLLAFSFFSSSLIHFFFKLFFFIFYNFTLGRGEWRVLAVMAIRATG